MGFVMQTEALIQVLVVEDSMTMRRFLVDLINQMPGMMVCGEAHDGVEALKLVKKLQPSVISMDIHLPKMDGVEATREIMQISPTPIVVASSGVGQREVDVAMLALEAGALAAIPKPSAAPQDKQLRSDYLRMLYYMAKVSVVRRYKAQTMPNDLSAMVLKSDPNLELIVMGASAGGPGTLARVLEPLPADLDIPILVVQHLSAEFVQGFVNWLDRRVKLPVRQALAGQIPVAGEIWVAPGGYHMRLDRDGHIQLVKDQGEYRHQPAVDVLFESAATLCGANTVGVLLTGMGDDGAQGLEKLKAAGGRTIVQDQATSVVFGMPAAAIERGAAQFVLPDAQIARVLQELCVR